MQGLRTKLRKLRFLIWFALAFALFSYIVKPLKNAFWKPVDADKVCSQLQHGEKAFDRWGSELSYDATIGVARSPGPDKQFGTGDDIVIGCL